MSTDDCRRYLDQWRDSAPGTRYHAWAVLSGFFKWLYRAEIIGENPMWRIEPPRAPIARGTRCRLTDRLRREAGCSTSARPGGSCSASRRSPTLALVVAPSRSCAGADVDLDRGAIRFREKGAKTIRKPIPREFAALLKAARSVRAGCDGGDGVRGSNAAATEAWPQP